MLFCVTKKAYFQSEMQKDQKKESAEQIADSIIKSMGLPVTSHPTKCEDDGINA